MYTKVVIELLILLFIYIFFEMKIDNNRKRIRIYKLLRGLIYIASSILSFYLVEFVGEEIGVYIMLGMIFGIGSLLSAITPNLRDIFMGIILYSIIVALAYEFLYANHYVVFWIITIYSIIGIISVILQAIHNIGFGIDPDEVEREKEERKKFMAKAKLAFKIVTNGMKILR